MNCYSIPNIFFISLMLIAPLFAARVKQVCRRPAEARQFPQAKIAPRFQDQGVKKPSRKKIQKVVIEEDNELGRIGKVEKQYLEIFRDKCVTLLADGRDLDDQAYDLFVKSADILEEPEKRYASDDVSLLLEKIRKRANL